MALGTSFRREKNGFPADWLADPKLKTYILRIIEPHKARVHSALKHFPIIIKNIQTKRFHVSLFYQRKKRN